MANLKFDPLHRVITFLDESKDYKLCREPALSTEEDDGSEDWERGEISSLSSLESDEKSHSDAHTKHHDSTNHQSNHDKAHDDEADYQNQNHEGVHNQDHDPNADEYEYDDYDYAASLGSLDTSMVYHVSVLEDAANKKRKRSMAKSTYDRARNILEEQLECQSVSTEVLSELFDELCEAYRKLDDANRAYLPYLEPDSEEFENNTIFMENAYRDRCRIQESISKSVNSRLSSGIPQHGGSDYVTNGSPVSNGNKVQMFLIEPPKFSGDIRRYPTFVKDYTKYMESAYGRDAYALRTCLSGKALDVVAGSDDNYEEIWRKLNLYYLNPERLVHSILKEIRTLSPLKDNDSLGFIELVDTVERCWHDLRKLTLQNEMDTSAIIGYVERLLPRCQRRKWVSTERKEVHKSDDGGLAESERSKFELFLGYLLREKEVYEYMQFYGTSV